MSQPITQIDQLKNLPSFDPELMSNLNGPVYDLRFGMKYNSRKPFHFTFTQGHFFRSNPTRYVSSLGLENNTWFRAGFELQLQELGISTSLPPHISHLKKRSCIPLRLINPRPILWLSTTLITPIIVQAISSWFWLNPAICDKSVKFCTLVKKVK